MTTLQEMNGMLNRVNISLRKLGKSEYAINKAYGGWVIIEAGTHNNLGSRGSKAEIYGKLWAMAQALEHAIYD